MSVRTRAVDEARRQWMRMQAEIGDQLRTARRILGVSQSAVGAAIGVSTSEISRRELGRSARLSAADLAVHAAAVGLKLSVRLFPVGGGLRDTAQTRYLAAFVARIERAWKVTLEAGMAKLGDLRAVDVLLVRDGVRIAVEVITRLTDLQAQVRAAERKRRDIGGTRLILVVSATHANRAALAEARPALLASFDLDTRRILAELASGRDPGRDGIVLLTA